MKSEKLNLFFKQDMVGTLTQDKSQRIEFTYDSSWLGRDDSFAVSHSMPLQETAFKKEAENFFANLLPEGEVRVATARTLGISLDNDFRLLEALGGECAGALTIGHKPLEITYQYEELVPNKLKEIFESGGNIFSSMQSEVDDVRLSLAGAQDKIPVCFDGGRVYIPQGNSPSTHILKLPSHRFKYLPQNECLLGMFAENMNLIFPTPELVNLSGLSCYLIPRYDRINVGKGVERMHQEDFCQALGYSYKTKYEKDGGPSFFQVYQLVEKTSSELPNDLERILRWLIFNVIVGNCDAHAKNLSLLMTDKGVWSLSPHYDIVSTRVYPRVSKSLAMNVGGAVDSGTVTGTHWRRLAKEIKMGPQFVLDTVEEMAEVANDLFEISVADFVEKNASSSIIDELRKVVVSQSRRLRSQLKK